MTDDLFSGLTNARSTNPFPLQVVASQFARLFDDDGALVMCYAPPWIPYVISHPYVAPMILAGFAFYEHRHLVPPLAWLALQSPAGEVLARAIADHYNPVPA